MQTTIPSSLLDTPHGRQADQILRSCVHCGFCTATCPTYQLLGDELDGPRGRIYLIKQMLEGHPVTRLTQRHLDRCLTCRSCETTCPSGVHYGRLLDIGRELAEQRVTRPIIERAIRWGLRKVLPYPQRLGSLVGMAQRLRPLLPPSLRVGIPPRAQPSDRPRTSHPRQVLILEGCAQSVITPNTNAATARVLDRLGISLISSPLQGCCGAVSHHLSAAQEALGFVRRNIDAWWPHIEAGAEAVLITASGCGAMVKDYGELMSGDPRYRERATQVASLAKDLGEFLAGEEINRLGTPGNLRVAFHSPCTLQHGQQLPGVVEKLLTDLGFILTPTSDEHLCCGSAGTYSILQPALSQQLLSNKLPDVIATANIGCQLHLGSRSRVPVRHWIELVDQALAE